MNKTLRVAAGLVAGMVALLGAVFAAPALAEDLVGDSASCLAKSHVCSYGDASVANQDGLAQRLPDGVSVLVVPQDSVSPVGVMSADQLASAVGGSVKGVDTLVVVVDATKDRFGLYTVYDNRTEILTALNQNNTGDGGEAIVASLAVLTPPQGSTETTPAGGFPYGILIGVVALLVVIGGAVGAFLRARAKAPAIESPKVDKKLFDSTENADEIERDLERLRQLADFYAGNKSKYAFGNQPVSAKLGAVLTEVQELFRRLKAKGTAQQLRLAALTYSDVLRKLLMGVETDYLKDIQDNPRLWDNADARVREVGSALDAVLDQVVDNIKQVNASRDLEFKVALDSLVSSTQAPKLEDVYGDTKGKK